MGSISQHIMPLLVINSLEGEHTHKNTHKHTHTHTNTHTNTNTQTHTHTYTHKYTYTRKHICILASRTKAIIRF